MRTCMHALVIDMSSNTRFFVNRLLVSFRWTHKIIFGNGKFPTPQAFKRLPAQLLVSRIIIERHCFLSFSFFSSSSELIALGQQPCTMPSPAQTATTKKHKKRSKQLATIKG